MPTEHDAIGMRLVPNMTAVQEAIRESVMNDVSERLGEALDKYKEGYNNLYDEVDKRFSQIAQQFVEMDKRITASSSGEASRVVDYASQKLGEIEQRLRAIASDGAEATPQTTMSTEEMLTHDQIQRMMNLFPAEKRPEAVQRLETISGAMKGAKDMRHAQEILVRTSGSTAALFGVSGKPANLITMTPLEATGYAGLFTALGVAVGVGGTMYMQRRDIAQSGRTWNEFKAWKAAGSSKQ